MIGGFLGGLANAGGVVRGADEAQGEALRRALQQLAIRQYQQNQLQRQQQQQGEGALYRTLAQPGGLPQGMPSSQPGQVQQQPLAPPGPPQGPTMSPNLAGSGVNWQNENPAFQQRVSSMLAAAPPDIRNASAVDSGYRTNQQQADIYARSGQGTKFMAAPPGKSMHEQGMAADWTFKTPQADQWMHQNAGRFGLGFPLGARDPNHMQIDKQMSLPEPDAQAGTQLAGSIAQRVGPQASGLVDLQRLASALDKTAPGLPDHIKFNALMKLEPLLNQQSKAQLQEMWRELNFTEKQGEFRQREADRSADREFRQAQIGSMAEDRKARLEETRSRDEETKREHKAADEERTLRREQIGEQRKATAEAKTQKSKAEIDNLHFMAREAADLAEIAKTNPSVVGGRGLITRGYGTAKEIITGAPPEGQVEQESFKSRVEALQSRMSKEILGSRYFSGPALQRMQTLLPALNRFVAPTQAITAFQEIARQLDQAAGAAEGSGGTGSRPAAAPGLPDLRGISDEELLKRLQ